MDHRYIFLDEIEGWSKKQKQEGFTFGVIVGMVIPWIIIALLVAVEL